MPFRFPPVRPQWLAVVVVVTAVGVALVLAVLRPGEEPDHYIRPLPYRLTLVESLSAESTVNSIENLPNFDDVCWVAGDLSGGTMILPGTYRYTSSLIPKLNRVRKILQEGRSTRDIVIPKLKEVLARSLEGFEGARKRHEEKVSQGGYLRTAPDDFDRARTYASSAVYLLEELDAFDALPLVARVYNTKGEIPVHRLFLGYAIHLLAARHPREALSPEAVAALDKYLAAAKELPSPQGVDVPAWNASFTETDFRVMILHQNIGLDSQPKVRLNLYPAALAEYEDFYGNITVTFDPLVEAMNRFIKAAYPRDDLGVPAKPGEKRP